MILLKVHNSESLQLATFEWREGTHKLNINPPKVRQNWWNAAAELPTRRKRKDLTSCKIFSPSSTEMQFLVEAFTINSSVACAFFPFVSYFSLVAYVGLDDGSSNFFTAQSVCMQCMHQFFIIIIRRLRHNQLKWNSWWSFILNIMLKHFNW